MEGNLTNYSNYTAMDEGGFLLTDRIHLLLHSLLLILICFPTLILTLGSIIALLIAKPLTNVMRLVLIHMLLTNGGFAFGTTLWIIGFPIRYLSDLRLLSADSSCRVVGSIFAAGGVGRFFSVALFSIVVFILVKHRNKLKGKKIYYIVGTVFFQWAFSVLWSLPAYLPSYGWRITATYLCGVRISSSRGDSALLLTIHVVLSWVFIGSVSFITTLTFATFTHFYIKKNSIRDNDGDLKATANKLSLLLALSLAINLIGVLLIPTFSIIIPFSGALFFLLAFYIPLSLMTLSALPIPLIMILLLKPVRLALKRILKLIIHGCKYQSNAVAPQPGT